MGTIVKRNNRFLGRVRVKGAPPLSRTFGDEQSCIKWIAEIERQAATGEVTRQQVKTLDDALAYYLRTKHLSITSQKCVLTILNHNYWLTAIRLDDLRRGHFTRFVEERTRLGKAAASVCRDISVFRAAINHVIKYGQWDGPNPCLLVPLPRINNARTRTLSSEEEAQLMELAPTKIKPIIQLALLTACRRGELLSLDWQHVNFDQHTAYLPTTKNGSSRFVPLSAKAIEILKSLNPEKEGKIFNLSAASLSTQFATTCKRAEITDLVFHSLRHTAITRAASKLSNVLELQMLSGHKKIEMLARYTHMNATAIAMKL